ncbi:scavenger mRNA decapping enzyme [Schizopora paradoxa]|uniref:Scavenger mRNA decapping enzyme n=1 Tax=Schizopora paradoxa TaxID=27342 RepID=A0A0H2RL18_9AGAM|nr:scavenger mRNA decapping enzyme [Schizopora paradoxa]
MIIIPNFANIETIRSFVFERVLNDDPFTHSSALLGTLPSPVTGDRSPAIIRVERSPIAPNVATSLPGRLAKIKLIESTDIYSWLLGWLKNDVEVPDVKINIIFPATEVHIRKYTKQSTLMVQETPEIYERIVKPYIASFPASRTQWVEHILRGVSEADKVLYRDDSPQYGFVLLPDMKWDLTNISTLYLVAISLNRGIRSLRDLKKEHLGMLRSIKSEASRIVQEKWHLDPGCLRFFIHYQPSYYHFHVHIVNANYVGIPSMAAGQAHILEDVISLLELSPDDGPTILEKMTFSYGLGDQHGLFPLLHSSESAES